MLLEGVLKEYDYHCRAKGFSSKDKLKNNVVIIFLILEMFDKLVKHLNDDIIMSYSERSANESIY